MSLDMRLTEIAENGVFAVRAMKYRSSRVLQVQIVRDQATQWSCALTVCSLNML
jgi:hypothetical protein